MPKGLGAGTKLWMPATCSTDPDQFGGSFNGRTALLQSADKGSIPLPPTKLGLISLVVIPLGLGARLPSAWANPASGGGLAEANPPWSPGSGLDRTPGRDPTQWLLGKEWAPQSMARKRWVNSLACIAWRVASPSQAEHPPFCGRGVRAAREVVALLVWVQIPSVTPFGELG